MCGNRKYSYAIRLTFVWTTGSLNILFLKIPGKLQIVIKETGCLFLIWQFCLFHSLTNTFAFVAFATVICMAKTLVYCRYNAINLKTTFLFLHTTPFHYSSLRHSLESFMLSDITNSSWHFVIHVYQNCSWLYTVN